MSKDKAICAQIKPNTVSIRHPVKLLPTCGLNESLSVSLKPASNDSWPDLGVTSFPGFDPFGDYPGRALARAQGVRTVWNAFYNPELDRVASRLRVNLIDRNVDVHVVRVVMDDAHPLMFSVAKLLAKTLLDHAQRLSIGIFSGPERNQQMIGAI